MKYAIYNSTTGEIAKIIGGDPTITEAKKETSAGQSLYAANDQVIDDLTHYIDTSGTTPTPQPRTQTACTASATTVSADGVSTITLSGLAANTQIDIQGPVASSFTNSAASEDLTFGAAGEYTITATAPFPALPNEIKVTANGA